MNNVPITIQFIQNDTDFPTLTLCILDTLFKNQFQLRKSSLPITYKKDYKYLRFLL